MLLPPEAPSISDFQRSKVLSAEASISGDSPPAPTGLAEEACARASELGGGLLSLEQVDGADVVYVRESDNRSRLEVGREAAAHALLRGSSHHLVHPVFPPHGVEWVSRFLGSLRAHGDDDAALEYEAAYRELEVHTDPAVRVRRARKSALGAVNKERGVLARIIADDRPESVVCQMLEVADGALRIYDSSGERSVDLPRLRYLAYRLSEG